MLLAVRVLTTISLLITAFSLFAIGLIEVAPFFGSIPNSSQEISGGLFKIAALESLVVIFLIYKFRNKNAKTHYALATIYSTVGFVTLFFASYFQIEGSSILQEIHTSPIGNLIDFSGPFRTPLYIHLLLTIALLFILAFSVNRLKQKKIPSKKSS
jgi:hypothetical protein